VNDGAPAKATALDVAAHLLTLKPDVTREGLQALLYYAQAWSLLWDGVPIFDDPIEAWAQGPVVRSVWEATEPTEEAP